MLDSAINLLGLAIAVATIIGVYIVYFVFKTFRDDKSFGVSHVPEVQSLEQSPQPASSSTPSNPKFVFTPLIIAIMLPAESGT